MSPGWATILALAVGTIAIKSAGPVVLAGRSLPPRLGGVIMLLAPALLAALVAIETFGGAHGALVVDARIAGLAAAAAALLARRSLTVVVLVAAVATALARALA